MTIKRLIRYLARQKLRFDIAMSFMAVLNFAVIVIAASDKLALIFHAKTRTIVLIVVPGALVLVWGVGFVLDKLEFFRDYQSEQNERNETLKGITHSLHEKSNCPRTDT